MKAVVNTFHDDKNKLLYYQHSKYNSFITHHAANSLNPTASMIVLNGKSLILGQVGFCRFSDQMEYCAGLSVVYLTCDQRCAFFFRKYDWHKLVRHSQRVILSSSGRPTTYILYYCVSCRDLFCTEPAHLTFF